MPPTVKPRVLKALIECLVVLHKVVSHDDLAQLLGYAPGDGKRNLDDVLARKSTSKATVEEAYTKFLVEFPRDVAALRQLSIRLKAQGVSLNAQSACVGYCGKNGSRDMTAVFDKRSITATPAEAYVRLLKKFHRLLTSDSTVVKSEAAAPAPDAKKKSQAMAPAPAYAALRKAFLSDNETALRLLSDELLANNVSLKVQTQWLGYSGKNGTRDIQNVIKGTSRITRDEAFETLCAIMFP